MPFDDDFEDLKDALAKREMDRMRYDVEEYEDGKGRSRHGSPQFYKLLEKMAEIHDAKSHDYASNSNPYGNYHFAGQLSKLFNNPDDSGFVGRIGEKLFRLANLENSNKVFKNESIADTEIDICVITLLWMSDRQERRNKKQINVDLSKSREMLEKPFFSPNTKFREGKSEVDEKEEDHTGELFPDGPHVKVTEADSTFQELETLFKDWLKKKGLIK